VAKKTPKLSKAAATIAVSAYIQSTLTSLLQATGKVIVMV